MDMSIMREETVIDSEGHEGVVGMRYKIPWSIIDVYAMNSGPEGAARVISFGGGAGEKAETIFEIVKREIQNGTYDAVILHISELSIPKPYRESSPPQS